MPTISENFSNDAELLVERHRELTDEELKLQRMMLACKKNEEYTFILNKKGITIQAQCGEGFKIAITLDIYYNIKTINYNYGSYNSVLNVSEYLSDMCKLVWNATKFIKDVN